MLLLVSGATSALHLSNKIGVLMSPRRRSSVTWLENQLNQGKAWACDNDAFSGFDAIAYLKMLKRFRDMPDCLFVTAPDVVADAKATMKKFLMWEPLLHRWGYPVALVAQDGLENLIVPWHKIEALFIGGSTAWKLSIEAAQLAYQAKERGKWVHMGRVNSNARLRYAQALDCDSVDGTGFSRAPLREIGRAKPILETKQHLMFDFSGED